MLCDYCVTPGTQNNTVSDGSTKLLLLLPRLAGPVSFQQRLDIPFFAGEAGRALVNCGFGAVRKHRDQGTIQVGFDYCRVDVTFSADGRSVSQILSHNF